MQIGRILFRVGVRIFRCRSNEKYELAHGKFHRLWVLHPIQYAFIELHPKESSSQYIHYVSIKVSTVHSFMILQQLELMRLCETLPECESGHRDHLLSGPEMDQSSRWAMPPFTRKYGLALASALM